jgi:hypothetical protein
MGGTREGGAAESLMQIYKKLSFAAYDDDYCYVDYGFGSCRHHQRVTRTYPGGVLRRGG